MLARMTQLKLSSFPPLVVQSLEEDVTPSPLPVFHWIPLGNLSHRNHCRNSQQGHQLIVDELGEIEITPPHFPGLGIRILDS